MSLLYPCYIAKRLRWTDGSQLAVDGSFSGARVNVSPLRDDAIEVLTKTSPIGEVGATFRHCADYHVLPLRSFSFW
jgi:hypothetical protein